MFEVIIRHDQKRNKKGNNLDSSSGGQPVTDVEVEVEVNMEEQLFR